MKNNDLVFDLSARSIDKVVGDVDRFLRDERGLEIPPNRIREAMADVLYRKFDLIAEDLREIFTSPHREEVHELEKVLRRSVSVSEKADAWQPVQHAAPIAAIFSGNRAFSAEKMGAMIEYILGKSRSIYKTNLNKLLFYADLTAFYLRGAGMSGAVYLNRPYGPVADPTADVLDDLIEKGRVSVADKTKHLVAEGDALTSLSGEEMKVLDWVIDTYGDLGAREISDMSHEERAYKDTRPNEPIAYAYAKFFNKLPPEQFLA